MLLQLRYAFTRERLLFARAAHAQRYALRDMSARYYRPRRYFYDCAAAVFSANA